MRILCITNGTASHLWRLTPYLQYAEQQGNEVMMHNVGVDVNPMEFIWADVVIAEMILEKRIIDEAHKYGCVVIYEIDDLIEKVTKNHPNYINMTRMTTLYRTYNCIRKCDSMFCSNENIRKRYGWMAKDSFIVPNLIDSNYWLKVPNPNTGPHIRIGWAGSFAHYEDLKFFQPIIKKILEKYENVKFIYVGMGGWHGDPNNTKFIYGEDLFNEIPINRREYHPGVPAMFWSAKLNSLQLDIGVAPIFDNAFARAKTPIKWMEYAVNSVAFVGSKCLYGDIIKHGQDGFIAENAEEFYNYLCQLIENKNLRQQMGLTAHQRVISEFDITKFQPIWLKKIIQLVDTSPIQYKARKEVALRKFQELVQKEKDLYGNRQLPPITQN